MLKYLEHLSVVLQNVREQLSKTQAPGDLNEMLQKQRRRASMLILVGNDESHLSTACPASDADELTERDELLASSFPNRQGQANVIVEIELGRLAESARREIHEVVEEALVDRLRR